MRLVAHLMENRPLHMDKYNNNMLATSAKPNNLIVKLYNSYLALTDSRFPM